MTTFAATAIHHDLRTSHGLVREELCWKKNQSLDNLDYWLNECPANVVVQAPFAADVCHQYRHCLVVFMRRPIEEIETSQKRMFHDGGETVFWPGMELVERQKYNDTQFDRPISEIKYDNWALQREKLAHYLELNTDMLKSHPLYVRKDDRRSFHVRQTSAVA